MDFQGDEAVRSLSVRSAPLRLMHVTPDSGDAVQAFAAQAERAVALGFAGIVLASPFAARGVGGRALVSDFNQLGGALGGGSSTAALTAMAAAGRRAGLTLLLDVELDRLAAGSAAAVSARGLFEPPDDDALLDPRRLADARAASVTLASAGSLNALADWWADHLSRWHKLGVAGFRLAGLAGLPRGAASAVLRRLRQALPETLLLAWTPGLEPDELASLEPAGLDGVFSSLPWWDWQSPWLWEELERLERVAPVIGLPCLPGRLPEVDALPGSRPGAAASRCLALAAGLGGGWLVDAALADADADTVISLNRLLAEAGLPLAGRSLRLLGGSGAPVLSLLRSEVDPRLAAQASLLLINTDTRAARAVDPALLLSAAGGNFGHFTPVTDSADGPEAISPATATSVPAGGYRLFEAVATPRPTPSGRIPPASAQAAAATPRLAIEGVTPVVDDGLFPVKRVVGELVSVEADVICDGHDVIAVRLQWQGAADAEAGPWHEAPMRNLGNDRWTAAFPLTALGRAQYRVQAWRDAFATYRDELSKKHAAGVDTALEIIEGLQLVGHTASRVGGALAEAHAALQRETGPDRRREMLLSARLASLMAAADDRPRAVCTPAMPVKVERTGARFAAWYEVFPRSMSDDPARHGTFADVERHLPRVAAMGFDVLYFPPIHPIGLKNRKGPNNSLTPAPEDVGSPYAIGSAEGGHDALHPALGSFEDFERLRAHAATHGLELAIDFAVQCSPDHPWLAEHPGWFDWRPDGSIRYAENPPKKYQDIVNVDFYAEDAIPSLWLTLAETVLFWAGHGVRLFRVDNPHTKPFPFWQWLIGEVCAQYPDAVFLAEAFTRPKVMYRLAKVGFGQSYTYFTWRDTKRELIAYFTELATTAPREFFRPHLFVNTPDINPPFLQRNGRPGHLIRAALAATLSGLWGVYSGFELCEATPLPGREEYLDSEKYQLRAWDWDRPGNIVPEITRLNRIRRDNPALQSHLDISFLDADNEAVIHYERATADRSNVLLVSVNLDPSQPHEATIEVPLWKWRLPDSAAILVEDLLSGARFSWTGKSQRVRLAPEQPYAIWRLRAA